jgi:uncharacterized protein YigE (DUF2233 family)
MTTLLVAWTPAAQAVQFERVESNDRTYVVARVDPAKERIEIFPAPEQGNTFAQVEQAVRDRGKKLVFAMNAGMYHPDYSAVGLLVVDGKLLHRLNAAANNPKFNFTTKPNGVFAVTKRGARVVESGRYKTIAKGVVMATQSGPALVLGGAVHPGLRPTSTSRHVRNGVGVAKSGEVFFAISESGVTLHEFATLFRDRLGCPDALYFDGSVSSLYAPALKRRDAFNRLGPIVGVVE